jgi:hypothetical protein
MKTKIKIKGQPGGNYILQCHVQPTAEKVEKSFNDVYIYFQTKKEARHALRTTYKNLKELEPEFYHEGGISLVRGELLIYDASRAEIL